MDPMIVDKRCAALLAELASGTSASTKRHSDILWSLILHDGCYVPPFLDEAVVEQLRPLERNGLLEFQSLDVWKSFQTSLNPIFSDAVEFDDAMSLRFKQKYDVTLRGTPDHANHWQVYGPGVENVSDRVIEADSFLTKNVHGLEPLLLEFAASWGTGLSAGQVGRFCRMEVPLFAHTLGRMPASALANPSFLDDWSHWFADAWGDECNDFVEHNFDVIREAGISTLQEANAELKSYFNSSFTYFCRKRRLAVPYKWDSGGNGQVQFERALSLYLGYVADQIVADTDAFVTFWDLVYKAMYLVSEAQFNGAAVCIEGCKNLPAASSAFGSAKDCLRVVQIIERETMSFPRLRNLNDALRLRDDKHFDALRENVWDWKRELFAAEGANVDDLAKTIRSDMKALGDLPKYRAQSSIINVLAMSATMLDTLIGTCTSLAFVPLGVFYEVKIRDLERRTEWCLVGHG